MDWINAIIQGVLLGGLFALFAAGLSLVFGVMRLVNLAHGDLIILAAFIALAVTAGVGMLGHSNELPLFKSFYVTLIFADVLIVLLSMRYSVSHAVVFRNAGFAATALLIRVALSAPPFLNAAIGLTSAGLLIGLAAAYRFSIVSSEREGATP